MKTSRSRFLPVVLPLSLLSLAFAACEGKSEEDAAKSNKMASDLVQCKNDLSSQKEKIAELTAELSKLRAATDPTRKLDAIDLKAGPTEKPHKDGNISPQQVSAVIGKNSAGLRTCYEKGLKRNPNLQYVSTVNVRFSVKNTGEASDVGFSPPADAEMEKCMGAAIAKWHFPTFEGDAVQVEAPVNLVAK